MTLRVTLPTSSERSAVDFETFQRIWHHWQLSMPPEDRGKAAEIALKNLERGLVGRDAATLVGDVGATPRLPALVAAFASDTCKRLHAATQAGEERVILEEVENRLSQAVREITMTTHDRAEALMASEFLARVTFRLIFQSIWLPPTHEWHPLDRHTAPSIFWRALRSVRKSMPQPFIRQVYIDAERLCMRQSRRAPLAGELGGARFLDRLGDLEDLGEHHTDRLPTPQSNERQRELFGLSGGLNAALPAILYLAWKYEKQPTAALTANALLGGNSAGRAVVLGMLLGARTGKLGGTPKRWLAQLQSAKEVLEILGNLSPRHVTKSNWHLDYTPCPASLCPSGVQMSRVITNLDVQIAAIATSGVDMGDRGIGERHALVQLNISNIGNTGMPICPHGKLWLLWEAGGFARGRFRSFGGPAIDDVVNVSEQCLEPKQWKLLAVNVTTSEPEAMKPGDQHMVGLLEIVRPLRDVQAQQRMQQPGAGNLMRAIISKDGPVEVCEHFAAKVGRFEIPTI
jgi:ADP-ribosylglycohydrolase